MLLVILVLVVELITSDGGNASCSGDYVPILMSPGTSSRPVPGMVAIEHAA